MLKKDSGITLMALLITIIILLILVGTAIYTGTNSIQSSTITNFKTEMKEVRLQLNSLEEIEKYKKNDNDILTDEQINFINKVQTQLNSENINIVLNTDNFKYFSKEKIKELSNLDISRGMYIDAKNKYVVSSIGEEYDGKTYYMLEELEDNLYNVEENIKDSGTVTYDVANYGLTIEISNINYSAPYVEKGSIEYKLTTEDTWNTVAENTSTTNIKFSVEKKGVYEIKVTDAKNNYNIATIEIK